MKATVATSLFALSATAVSARSFRPRLSNRQTSCLLDTVSSPSNVDIAAAINQWNSDVVTVNTYLNNILSGGLSDPTDLLAATQAILITASDEPCQFGTLKNNPGAEANNVVPRLSCAISDLDSVFGPHVLDNLNTIITTLTNDPSDTTTVTNAVADINQFRCCNVLPDVDTLFFDSAAEFGLLGQVPTSVPLEDACASISCTPACAGDSNIIPSAAAAPIAAASGAAKV